MRENRKADVAALSIATVMSGFVTFGAIPWWLTMVGLAATLIFLCCTIYVALAGHKPQLDTSDPQPRQLASTAQDEAAKAADLGLPTGVWTDLAATWTTWADQDDADKPTEAPEEPVKRPTPPPDGGGAGHVPWVVDAPPGSSQSDIAKMLAVIATQADRDYKLMQNVARAISEDPIKSLPAVRQTEPASMAVAVGHLTLNVPPAATLRHDLVIYRNEDPATGQWQAPTVDAADHWHYRIVHNVPADTTSYDDLDTGHEVHTLARIHVWPGITGIPGPCITDLRVL